MTDKQKLAVWLGNKNRVYSHGVALYKALAVNPDRNKFYSDQKAGKMHENMLLNDLQRYARIHKIQPSTIKIVQKQQASSDAAFKKVITQAQPTHPDRIEQLRVQIVKNEKVDYEKLPEELKEVYDQFNDLYNGYDENRELLQSLPKQPEYNEKRKESAELTISFRKKIVEGWEKIDTWWKNLNSPTGDGDEITQASGKYTKAQIEAIKDEGIKALSKQKRIEANMKFIQRNHESADKNVIEKVAERKKELDQWTVDYAKVLTKNT
jgi:regulatory protein YycI of two-component signal transduction system YycFG